ncbi:MULTISPECIES: neutral zinc metallopeptidase [Streptosporangium]|uniref:Metalloprotease n=1 Tax=Streptosporangium brasiliense TaxID=47480 RepID=A0ABT9QYV1_9ACTN|nr:neutral zinc metallopeptidase [Streptosporangium brasiliense]MDP9862151.1 putative metalloprotease [Streptosporangium brasiliense]
MSVRRWRAVWLVLALASLITVGAGGGAASASARQADDMDDDISAALYVVNRYWAAHWPRLFTGRYSAPAVFGGYQRGGRKPPFCGAKRLDYDNAWYCHNGDYIAWDVDLMEDGYRSGDAWVYLVIAHEWGHAVQRRLHDDLVLRTYELQADCLAGAVLYGAADDGILRFERGDLEEIAEAHRRLGDETPWTDISDHGTAAQRMSAFKRGARYGVPGCLPR